MARRLLLAQHKPYSFLSPSANPVGRKRFALELLTLNNQSNNGLRWAAAAPPCDVPGMLCAGRLDADSTGLMLWTNDHALCESVIGPRSLVEKECARLRLDCRTEISPVVVMAISLIAVRIADLVRVSGQEAWSVAQKEESARWLSHGIALDGNPLKPARVEWLHENVLRMTLNQGKFRQVRAEIDSRDRSVVDLVHERKSTSFLKKCPDVELLAFTLCPTNAFGIHRKFESSKGKLRGDAGQELVRPFMH
ncbi:MAG: hypothetical protein SGPRY_013951, partial [Prymnesium sp.]